MGCRRSEEEPSRIINEPMSKITIASKSISYLTDKQSSTLDTKNLKSDTQTDDVVLQFKRSTYSFIFII